jgi:hypothetical protein
MTKIYISKYALTTGIYTEDAKISDGLAHVPGPYGSTFFHGEGREYHLDYASALSKAEAMRRAKIASLRKQFAKLEKLVFLNPDE